jgi:3-dehydroquinate synthase
MAGQMSEPSKLEITSHNHKYSIEIQNVYTKNDLIDKRAVIIDSKLTQHDAHENLILNNLISIPGNEESKQFNKIESILTSLADMNVKRDESVSVIGGGSIQDIGTLVTSLYMRGIRWEYFPTTLASMMDSCIGGKSSINLGQRKNLIGNFHPPSRIIVNPTYLETLPDIEISAGISEGVKISYARGSSQLSSFIGNIRLWREKGHTVNLLAAIRESLESKKFFIEIDEFDKNERQLLNFGHSFGHALESSSGYSIPHGIAVLVGMLAAQIYVDRHEIDSEFIDFLFKEFEYSGLGHKQIKINREKLKQGLIQDKKNSKGKQVLILPDLSGALSKILVKVWKQRLKR